MPPQRSEQSDSAYLRNAFTGMAAVGLLVDLMTNESGTVPGLTVVVFSMCGLLVLSMASHRSQPRPGNTMDSPGAWGGLLKAMSSVMGFILTNGPMLFMMILICWYLAIFVPNQKYIIAKEMPSAWYQLSSAIGYVIAIQLVQIWHHLEKKARGEFGHQHWSNRQASKAYATYSDNSAIFMMIGCVVMAWLVMSEYVIANMYRTDG
jgi:hypothetical protein